MAWYDADLPKCQEVGIDPSKFCQDLVGIRISPPKKGESFASCFRRLCLGCHHHDVIWNLMHDAFGLLSGFATTLVVSYL